MWTISSDEPNNFVFEFCDFHEYPGIWIISIIVTMLPVVIKLLSVMPDIRSSWQYFQQDRTNSSRSETTYFLYLKEFYDKMSTPMLH